MIHRYTPYNLFLINIKVSEDTYQRSDRTIQIQTSLNQKKGTLACPEGTRRTLTLLNATAA